MPALRFLSGVALLSELGLLSDYHAGAIPAPRSSALRPVDGAKETRLDEAHQREVVNGITVSDLGLLGKYQPSAVPARHGSTLRPVDDAKEARLKKAQLGSVVNGITVTEELGAAYAPTYPLVGYRVPIKFRESNKRPVRKAACAYFAAATDRHAHWFANIEGSGPVHPNALSAWSQNPTGASPSDQQSGELEFANSIEALCENPNQTDDEFTEGVLNLLGPARTHISRHTSAAFWVKSACGAFDAACFDDDAYCDGGPPDGGLACSIVQPFDEHSTPTSSCYANNGVNTQIQTCQMSILQHERYNIAEGQAFHNMSLSLLAAGPQFCSDPTRFAQISAWNNTIEASKAYHRSAAQFDELLKLHTDHWCTVDDESEPELLDYETAYEAAYEQIDAAILAKPNCTFGANTFANMPYLESNPPSGKDLVTIWSQNAYLTLAQIAAYVKQTLRSEGQCIDEEGAVDSARATQILEQVEASGLPRSAFDAMGFRADVQDVLSDGGTSYSPMYNNVYHKLMVSCTPVADDPEDSLFTFAQSFFGASMGANITSLHQERHVAQCKTEDGRLIQPYTTPEFFVFDIGPAADITKCHGEACRAAARATLEYQKLLGVMTRMRVDYIFMVDGSWDPDGDASHPITTANEIVYQRSCAAFQNVADALDEVQERLPQVTTQLTEVSPQLDGLCVVPVRDFVTPEAIKTLGEERARTNGATMRTAVLFAAAEACNHPGDPVMRGNVTCN